MSHRKGEFPPVKHFVSILYADSQVMQAVRSELGDRLGSLDMESPPFPFNMTDYYQREMGTQLFRVFFVLDRLQSASRMVSIKKACLELEALHRVNGNRQVNLDPGYIDLYKLVLASEKLLGHKIVVSDGICADLTLLLNRHTVTTFRWTFPDFKSGLYTPFILEMREQYRRQLREQG